MKKYKDLYEEEKRRQEEALQRYQEDHIDEMEIINLHKRCNKNKTLRSKKESEPSLDDSAIEEEQKRSSDEKKSAAKAQKKVKKTSQSKKHQNYPNLLTQAKKKKKDSIKRKKCLP